MFIYYEVLFNTKISLQSITRHVAMTISVVVPLRSSVIKSAGKMYECVHLWLVACPIRECVDK